MSKHQVPQELLDDFQAACSNCWRDRSTGKGQCPRPMYPIRPFRFWKAKRGSLVGVKGYADLTLDLFDYEARWSEVLPLLDDPLAVRALNAGMVDLCEYRGGQETWNPDNGPWWYSRDFSWLPCLRGTAEEPGVLEEYREWCEAQGRPDFESDPEGWEEWAREDPMAKEKFNELMTSIYPQPRTPEWHRCHRACHWQAPWNGALGKLLFPDFTWIVAQTRRHSLAIGFDRSGMVCMDMDEHAVGDIWETLRGGCWISLMDQIKYLETRPHRDTREAA